MWYALEVWELQVCWSGFKSWPCKKSPTKTKPKKRFWSLLTSLCDSRPVPWPAAAVLKLLFGKVAWGGRLRSPWRLQQEASLLNITEYAIMWWPQFPFQNWSWNTRSGLAPAQICWFTDAWFASLQAVYAAMNCVILRYVKMVVYRIRWLCQDRCTCCYRVVVVVQFIRSMVGDCCVEVVAGKTDSLRFQKIGQLWGSDTL